MKKYSHYGTRTRACPVKAGYPNHLDEMGKLAMDIESIYILIIWLLPSSYASKIIIISELPRGTSGD